MKLRLALLVALPLLLAVAAQAKVITKPVPYQSEGLKLEGYLAYDDAIKGKRPGLLVVHEWWGLNEFARKRVEQLAAMGYVAFGLDMYGKGKVTNDPRQAGKWMRMVQMNGYRWRQRTRAGLEILKNDPHTDPDRIAAIGYTFGGTTVQQLAYSGADIKGVVSFHGSLLSPIPNLATKVRAKILLCHAGADSSIEPGEVEKYIADMGKTDIDWRMMIYGGAKQSFTIPDADKAGMDTLKYNKAADLHSWVLMKMFFDEIFAPE